ncbi:EamA family transporter [Oscillatoria sp. FACHB-1407]|uniref:EamA family transporter n=1 Tax=Oscillatoria sp. FACHB-1407 TaxID=2692847 RepID=UPI001684F613|nr:EamA family transporter [Oscillatoria sp. FACHB-1407]MBD2463365.1 EamA family transporter [Oscillatoria sp. FACHB-1407]
MGRLDDLPEYSASGELNTAESVLKAVTQDLKTLQHDLVVQLKQDVKRLQAEKSHLLNEIEKLQAQHEMLQSEQNTLLTRQQLAQQQLWAKQLAQALAAHLQTQLLQRMQADPYAKPGPNTSAAPLQGTANDNAYQVLSSIDATLNRTMNSLRQDLNSYQSSLSQQISRMQTLEQQGEAILQALVNRLSQQLQSETAARPLNGGSVPPGSGYRTNGGGNGYPVSNAPYPYVTHPTKPDAAVLPVPPVVPPEPSLATGRSPQRTQQWSEFQLGLVLILLSTIALSLHNVVVGIIGNPSSIFGVFSLGGYIQLNSLGNSLWILWVRMLIVLPLIAALATRFYPPAWKAIKSFFVSGNRQLQFSVVSSGFFLFLSQILIYIAIAQVGPGVAVTILFMYPIVVVPLAWLLFRDRPTPLRWTVMFAILSGVILTAFPKLAATTNISWLGVGCAVMSGIFFAFYLLFMQISFKCKLHPVPVSVIQFFTIFVLTSFSLLLPLGPRVLPDGQLGFIAGGIVLGTLTFLGYLLNNFGVGLIGPARAAIIASSGPVLTALLAFFITPSSRTALQGVQWLGIVIVTVSVIALSFEKMLTQMKDTKSVNAKPAR